MRIAHVIDHFQPKLGYQEFFLAREQARGGHDVRVITSDRYYPFPDYEQTVGRMLGPRLVGAGRFVEEGVDTLRLRTRAEAGVAIKVRGLTEALREFRPDAVHHHSTFSVNAPETLRARAKLGYHLAFDDHMAPLVPGPMRPLKAAKLAFLAYQRRVFGRALRRSGAPDICVTPDILRFVQTWYGIPPERTPFIPLGVETGEYRPDAGARAKVREELGLRDDERVLLYTGKVLPDKHVDRLVEACARANATLGARRWRLVVVGAGAPPLMDALRRASAAAGDVATFLPMRPRAELVRIYAAADVGAWIGSPSIAIQEALASGLPVAIAESDTTRHLVEGDHGWVLPEGDAARLADVLVACAQDPADLARRGAAARAHAERELDWAVLSRRCVDVYKGAPTG